MIDFEAKALEFAEKYGIVEYSVNEDKMKYREKFFENKWITFSCIVDLNTMEETRKRLYERKQNKVIEGGIL